MGKVYKGPEVKCSQDFFLLLTASRNDAIKNHENFPLIVLIAVLTEIGTLRSTM